MKKSSILLLEDEEKHFEQIILIISIVILSIICLILISIIIFLCYGRKQKSIETTIERNHFKRSTLSMVEKFQAPDLTTKVTLLTHFPFNETNDFGTDV